jgi:hypothetical protein
VMMGCGWHEPEEGSQGGSGSIVCDVGHRTGKLTARAHLVKDALS